MTMPPQEAAKVLRNFNDWRNDRNVQPETPAPNPREVTKAIDAAVAALEAVGSMDVAAKVERPGTAILTRPLPVGTALYEKPHARQLAEQRDAHAGNFRNNDNQNDGA